MVPAIHGQPLSPSSRRLQVKAEDRAVKGIGVLVVVLLAVLVGLATALYDQLFLGITLAVFWGFILARVLYGRRSLGDKWLMAVVLGGLLIRVPMVLAHLALGFLFYGGQLDFPGHFGVALGHGQDLLAGDLESFLNRSASQLDAAVLRLSGLTFLLIGPSLPGMFLVSGVLGFLGSYLFLRAFRVHFPVLRGVRFLAPCLFFFPSLAFWTSLLGKDSWMFLALGWVAYAAANLLKEIRGRFVLGLILSVALVTAIRPPVGLALVFAMGVACLLSLNSLLGSGPAAILRPVVYVASGVVVVGALMVVGAPLRHDRVFATGGSPVEGLLNLALSKHVGLSTDPTAGGSSLAVQITGPSATQVVGFLPLAMFTFLFRPLVFEAHNVLALIAGLDGTLLLGLVLWRWRHGIRAVRSALSRPFIAFCGVAFLLLTAGLSFEANFGVIVRHRAMVLPFLFMLLSVPLQKDDVQADNRQPVGSAEPGRP